MASVLSSAVALTSGRRALHVKASPIKRPAKADPKYIPTKQTSLDPLCVLVSSLFTFVIRDLPVEFINDRVDSRIHVR